MRIWPLRWARKKVPVCRLTCLKCSVCGVHNIGQWWSRARGLLKLAIRNLHCCFMDHVAALNRSCFFRLRRLRAIKQSLTSDATRTLVHAFVSSRLDSCSLLAGVSSQLLQRLQVVQNAAARLVTGARRSEHMTPVLRDLHWLPVRQRITFKTAVLVYKCLHGMASQYLQMHC